MIPTTILAPCEENYGSSGFLEFGYFAIPIP